MYYYLAPLEGITGHHFRRVHHEMFPGTHKYFSPFRVACQDIGFRKRELTDLLPENNDGVSMVPQILSNDAKAFLAAASQLKELGYPEINLNLGCPSGTVVAKYRGSGFLAVPKELDAFLDEVYSHCELPLSIKTRIGLTHEDRFEEFLEIYRKYPLSELIVHPRYGKDGYKGTPFLEEFQKAYDRWDLPLCYNGDLTNPSDFEAVYSRFPEIDSVMIGRGCVTNPGLIRTLETGEELTLPEFQAFAEKMYETYSSILSGDRNILFRMKELWSYFIFLFPDSRKQLKDIKKAQTCRDFEAAVARLYRECEFDPSKGFTADNNKSSAV